MKQILAALATVTIALLVGTSDARAWGVCSRGSWQTEPSGAGWGAESVCHCANGFRGVAQQTGFNSAGPILAYLQLSGGNNTGVGFEMEAYLDGQLIFVPANNDITGKTFTVPTGIYDVGLLGAPPWGSAADGHYVYSGRYRSVCITSYSSFLSSGRPTSLTRWSF